MAQENFDVGTIANDGTGDALRVAFQKQEDMNTELYTTKVDKVVGKELSDNNYTDDEVTKLDGIEAGAEVNVQADWEQSDDTQKDFIKNKPEELFSSVGYFHYTDTATQTTPLTIVADTNKKLTNDGLGAQTNLTQAPYGVSTLFNTTTNEFDFSQLSIGDTLDLRVDLSLTTTSANQKYLVFLRVGEGSVAQYDLPIFSGQIKNISSNNRIIGNEPFSIDYQEHIDNPATLYILSDDDGSVKVNGWYAAIIRKSINIVSFPIKEDKASGVIALGTDNYTATVPEVTELIEGYKILCSFENSNTGASTINVNGLGVKEIRKEIANQLVADDLLGVHFLMYDGTHFQLVGYNDGGTGGDFIPLSGTEVGSPITGDLILEDAVSIKPITGGGGYYLGDLEQGAIQISVDGQLILKASDNTSFKGLEGEVDFTPNLTDLSLTQKIYVDTPKLQTVTSSATVTPVSTNDIVTITAQATGLTLSNPTGTFKEGQALMIRIKDNGTARSITFGSNYRAIGVTLPTTTVISKTLYLGIIYNSTDAKWDVLGINQEA